MSFRVTIEEIDAAAQVSAPELSARQIPDGRMAIVRYEQTVDAIDLLGVIAAVNKGPRKVRTRKAKESP